MNTDLANLPTAPEPKRAQFNRVERLDALASGQYWRTTKDIHENEEEDHQGDLLVAKGVVLLVRSLRWVDNEVHTVVIKAHPSAESQADLLFMVEEFFGCFERCEDGPSIRQQEIAKVQASLQALQRQIQAGPAAADLVGAQEALPAPTVLVSDAIAAVGQLAQIKTGITRSIALQQRKAEWLQERANVLGDKTQEMGRFFAEQGSAALATVEEEIRFSEKVQEGLKSLTLYTGENVEVETLCKGAHASPEDPLTVYQLKLYLDEETLIHAAAGGADYASIDNFANLLAGNPQLMQRIFPTQRAVVLMQYRRENREYAHRDLGKYESVAAALRALIDEAQRNQENQKAFLLIRDGGNVHMVTSELACERAERLFPTQSEAGKPFEGVNGDTITLNDIRYTGARSQFDDVSLFYRRLLILLWGLNDRLQLLGPFAESAAGQSWLSLGFQNAHLRFIGDEEFALGTPRPTISKWRGSMNAYAREGSRLLCHWHDMINEDTAPGCYTHPTNSKSSQNYSPVESLGLAVVRRDGEDLYVECGVKHYYKRHAKPRKVRVQLGKAGSSPSTWPHRTGYLCLDRVQVDDVDFYLNSRRDRRDYLNYVVLFDQARALLRADIALEAPLRQSIAASLADAGVSSGGAAAVNDAVNAAIALWRSDNRGAPAPQSGSPAAAPIMDTVYALLKVGYDPTLQPRQQIEAEGRQVLRLALTGRHQVRVYATPLPAERLDFFFPHPWVQRITFKRAGGAFEEVERTWVLLPQYRAEEWQADAFPTASEWLELDAPGKLTYEQTLELKARIDRAAQDLDQLMAPDFDFQRLMGAAVEYTHRASDSYVQRGSVSIPVAVVRHQAYSKEYLAVLSVCVDAVGYIWQSGARLDRPELTRAAEKFIGLNYKQVQTNIEKLPDEGFPRLSSARIAPLPAGDATAVRTAEFNNFTLLAAHSGFRTAARDLHPYSRDTLSWHRSGHSKPPQYSSQVVYGPAEAEEACEKLRLLFLGQYLLRHPPTKNDE